MIIQEQHTSEENALIVDNYPYGFRLRTKIRYWIESNKNGDRFVSQTLNPKTNKWNKPKKSIYYAVAVMTQEENGHISFMALYPTTSKEEITDFLFKIGDYRLNDFQKEQLRILKAYSKVYENIRFEISETTDLSEAELKKHEEEQQKIKDTIRKAVSIEYLKLKEE